MTQRLGRTPGTQGQGPRPMDFNTQGWNFYVSLATNMYGHKEFLPSLFGFSRSPVKGDGSLPCWKEFYFAVKGRRAVFGICVWELRTLSMSSEHALSHSSL